MSASKHHHAPAPHSTGSAKTTRSSVWLMAWYVCILGVVLLFFFGLSAILRSISQDSLAIPDEKAAAAELLAKQLSGPTYFEVPAGDMRDDSGVAVANAAEPHLTAAAAKKQIGRIVKERHLSVESAAKVEDLIKKLTETPSSRLIGEDHVNLLRLNLALDELK